jgi:hypothetical protein
MVILCKDFWRRSDHDFILDFVFIQAIYFDICSLHQLLVNESLDMCIHFLLLFTLAWLVQLALIIAWVNRNEFSSLVIPHEILGELGDLVVYLYFQINLLNVIGMIVYLDVLASLEEFKSPWCFRMSVR